MRYIEEPFDNIFYEDDIIETKLTEEDEKNLEKIHDNIMELEYTEEIKDSIYYTIKDYYEEAIERGFRFVNIYNKMNIFNLSFEATEYKQTSLIWDKDDCEEMIYIINIACNFCFSDHIVYIYNESKTTPDKRRYFSKLIRGYMITIYENKNMVYNNIKNYDKKQMGDIIERIKFNFNIK